MKSARISGTQPTLICPWPWCSPNQVGRVFHFRHGEGGPGPGGVIGSAVPESSNTGKLGRQRRLEFIVYRAPGQIEQIASRRLELQRSHVTGVEQIVIDRRGVIEPARPRCT